MILDRANHIIFICISLCISVTQVASEDDSYSDAADAVSATYIIEPQDILDAEAIIADNMSETVLASILPYREKYHRTTIVREIGALSGEDYIAESYVPQQECNTPFKDLVYGISKDENMVLGGYLEAFFERKDETWIMIAMVLTKDVRPMMYTYDRYHCSKKFKDLRKKQRSPFENMLRVWVRQDRERNEEGEPDKYHVSQDARDLEIENKDGGWEKHRDQIEKVLIHKSIKYANATLAEFEAAEGKPIEVILDENSKIRNLNRDLADTYASFARYIKNKYKYMAETMFAYSDGTDKWAAWIMCMTVTHPNEWPLVNAEFQKIKNNEGVSLSQFIMKKLTNDKIMAEMIAVIVDSKFKPTTFTEKPVDKDAVKGLTPTPAPATSSNSTQTLYYRT